MFPELSSQDVVAIYPPLVLILNTSVPLKSLVGVITRVPVVVALGPCAPEPFALITKFVPPKSTVTVPAVLPVTVYVI